MKRYVLPVIFGFGGCAILITLAVWQIQRLEWKQALLADINARLSAAPVAVPDDPMQAQDQFRRITAEGSFVGPALHVLTSVKFEGPGFRVVQAFEQGDGRKVLVDRGYVPEADKNTVFSTGPVALTGTLLWPDEADSFTPDPNLERNIWFARDIPAMAEALGTEPLLIVTRTPTGEPAPRPLTVGVNIPNNHLQYAITWSLLALCWLAMTVYLLYRIRRNTV